MDQIYAIAADLKEFWESVQPSVDRGLASARGAWNVAAPYGETALNFLSNPWARAVGLTIIVYLTIRVIASVYSGDKQNSQFGPVGIRPHAAQRLDRDTVVLPRHLMPMNMDGVSANLKVYYAYVDARGKRCKKLIHEHVNARISVSPVKLTKRADTIYGQEIPDVATNDVCFPPSDMDQVPESMPATPDRAQAYAAQNKIIENWREDDDALLVSLHADEHETVRDEREQFLLNAAKRVASSREGNVVQRWLNRGVARQRANVVGSYYLKFEFSHEPWFVLTRHPDRELKMTAWLTVLTSMFALVMDAWPRMPSSADAPGTSHQSVREAPRVPRVPLQP